MRGTTVWGMGNCDNFHLQIAANDFTIGEREVLRTN